jgi:saccharopine dehydrogenase (NAD+, L-lysine-forming)
MHRHDGTRARRDVLLDLGGLYNTPKQLALSDEAKEKGVLIVLGIGATPGISNLMARDAADSMDSVEEIHVSFATFRPIAPSPGLLWTVLDEFSPQTRRFYYVDGAHVEAKPSKARARSSSRRRSDT